MEITKLQQVIHYQKKKILNVFQLRIHRIRSRPFVLNRLRARREILNEQQEDFCSPS